MPVFSALWGAAVFGDRLRPRQWAGVAACALGVLLLLAHEFGRLAGAPWAALAIVFSACVWAYGTHRLRRSTMPLATLTVAFWMTALTGVAVALAAAARSEHFGQVRVAAPAFVLYAVLQLAQLVLARDTLGPASTLPAAGLLVALLAVGVWAEGAARRP